MTPELERLPNSYPEDWPRQAIALIEGLEAALDAERAKVKILRKALEEIATSREINGAWQVNKTCAAVEALAALEETE